MTLGSCIIRVTNISWHYSDSIMSVMASQITSLTVVYSIVYSGTDQRKHESSASLDFVRGIHRWPVNSPHKGTVTRKMLPFDDIIMNSLFLCTVEHATLATITGTTILVPYLYVKSLQLIWSAGTHRFHLQMPDLQNLSFRDFTTWHGTRILALVRAIRHSVPFLLHITGRVSNIRHTKSQNLNASRLIL